MVVTHQIEDSCSVFPSDSQRKLSQDIFLACRFKLTSQLYSWYSYRLPIHSHKHTKGVLQLVDDVKGDVARNRGRRCVL